MGVPLLLSWLLAAACWTSRAGADPVQPYFRVVSYDLWLDLDLDDTTKSTFTGVAVVTLKTNMEVPQGDKNFVLNAAKLTPHEVILTYPNGRVFNVLPTKVKVDSAQETITIPAREVLANNSQYSIRMSYTGNYNVGVGLFRAQHNQKNYISTRFYPAYTKMVFPCIDQPGHPVPIKLTLNIRYNKDVPTVITGLTMVNNKKEKNVITNEYQSPISVPLSGVFITVGSYTKSSSNLYLPPDSVLTATTIVNVMESEVVQNLYSAVKMNATAVVVPGLPLPVDSGLGVAAISMSTALEDPEVPADGQKSQAYHIYYAAIRALYSSVVSPRNWNDTWLSESIPIYIAQKSFTQLPKFAGWKDMNLEAATTALHKTWAQNSMPVRPNFVNTSQVIAFISDPAVQKGATILGMMEILLPKENQMSTFVNFLSTKLGSSVTTEDFLAFFSDYNELNSSSNFPHDRTLQDLLQPWLNEPGFPAINLDRKSNEIVAIESRFGLSVTGDSNWIVPIYFKLMPNSTSNSDDDDEKLVWLMPSPNAEFKLASGVDDSTAILLNTQGPALFRTLYDSQGISLIGSLLKRNINSIPTPARATIIDDCFAFVKTGHLTYSALFDMLKYLENERDLDPWAAVARGLDHLHTLIYFKDDDLLTQFENFSADLLFPSYMALGLGLNDNDLMKGKTRSIIAQRLCDYGDLSCRVNATDLYNQTSLMPSDIIPVLYCNHLRGSNSTELQEFLNTKYRDSMNYEHKRSVFSYLACPSDNGTMNWYLNKLLVQGVINMPANDIVMAFKEVASRPEHLTLCFNFLTTRYNSLHKILKDEDKAMMFRILGEKGSSDDHILALRDFPMPNNSVVLEAVDWASKEVQARQDFLNKNYNDIVLAVFGYSPAPPTEPRPTEPTEPTPTSGPSPSPSPAKPTHGPSSGLALQSSVAVLLAALMAAFIR